MFDGFLLDRFSLFDDGFGPAEVGIRGRQLLRAKSPLCGDGGALAKRNRPVRDVGRRHGFSIA